MTQSNSNFYENTDFLKSNISKTIAVVDDEPDIVELVAIGLKKNGFLTKNLPGCMRGSWELLLLPLYPVMMALSVM